MPELDIDAILEEVTPVERTCPIVVRGDLVARMEVLEADLAKARMFDVTQNAPPTAEPIAVEIERVQQEITAATRTFRFQAIPGEDWADLIAEHPPTPDQRPQGWDYDPSSFPLYAIAASCVDPPMTPASAKKLYGKIGSGQWARLWKAAMAANTGVDSLPKSASATASLRLSGPSSTTAAPEGSPAASS